MAKHLLKVMIALVSVCAAYGISSLLRINHFVWSLLQDRFYQYISIFLPLLALWCGAWLLIRADKNNGVMRASVAGLIGGYVCGFLAFVLLPVYGSQSVQRIFTTRDLNGILFLSPLLALSWATGMIAAWVMWGLKTKFL